MNSFYEALAGTIAATEIASKGGFSYLSAATAIKLAGRPEVSFVDFNAQPHLACLGGSLVAIDLIVPGTDSLQRMYLPVMNQDNVTLTLAETNLVDINNSRQRALVKAVACVYGHGMSVYLGCDGDGEKAANMLKVTPDTDLADVTPVLATLKENGATYVEWGVAIAAARITDPTFLWEVKLYHGFPYRESLGGLLVDVSTVYRGKHQMLSLPIMDAAFKSMPTNKVSVFDWNKTVMRALTKCLAFNSGYGLSAYTGEDLSFITQTKIVKAKPKAETKVEAKAKTKAEEAPVILTETEAANIRFDAFVASVSQVEPIVVTLEPEVVPVVVVAPEVTTAIAADGPLEAAFDATVASEVMAELAETTTRFKSVMTKRNAEKGIDGLVALFDAIAVSTKFTAAEKPVCFGLLTTAVVSLANQKSEFNLTTLLAKMSEYKTMTYVAADNFEAIASKLTRLSIADGVSSQEDDALLNITTDLISAGIAKDAEDVFRLANIGKVPVESIELLRVVLEDTMDHETA